MELTLALAQIHIVPLEPLKNLERIESYVRDAKKRGADLVVFPEDVICGPLAGQTAFVQYAPEYLARMQQLAIKYGVDLVPGTWTVAENGLLYNQAHYIQSDGALIGTYRKINLWDTEKVVMTPGTVPAVFPTRFGKVGLIICWDISFPPLFTSMNEQGVELVISPTYWSFTRPEASVEDVIDDEILLIDSLCTARAFENNILFAYCNAAGNVGLPNHRGVLSGRSQITHPHDKVLCKCEGNDEELLLAHVKLSRVAPTEFA